MHVRKFIEIIDLIDGKDNRFVGFIKHFGNETVVAGKSHLPVYDENDDIRFVDGELGLSPDFGLEGCIGDFHTTGIDEGKPPGKPFRGAIKTVAGHAREILDDGNALPDNAVEARGLSNVGGTDESNKP